MLEAALEEDLACVIAGIPAVDFPGVARANEPWVMHASGRSQEHDVDWDRVRAATHVVSPLAIQPRVPLERRFIDAATADRVTRPDQARALWRQWGEPEIHWYQSGHVAGMWKHSARRFVESALAKSELIAPGR